MGHFRTKEREGVKVIECVPLAEAGFAAAFSTRFGGVSGFPSNALNLGFFSGDSRENVNENRRRFLAALGLESSNGSGFEIVTAHQIHSAESRLVLSGEETGNGRVSCDAFLTDKPNVLLGVQTADCLPVLIADPARRAAAGIHAGWRGTLARITERTVERMRSDFGTDPKDCLAAMGPAIGQCCFEVGEDVWSIFEKEFLYGRDLFTNRQSNGKAHMDLRAANREQLLAAGVQADNIFVLPDCTRCRMDLYFSYRGERAAGAVGRSLSVIGIKGDNL